MIAVAGEALMDLVVDPSGSVIAVPGGGPFNAARMVARLGTGCRFLGRLSDDTFGTRLRMALEHDAVEVVVRDPVAAPTTLAVAELDAAGVARYRFYLDGTSAGQLRPEDLPDAAHVGIQGLLLGGLGLVLEPMATTLLGLMSRLPAHVVVMVDPNCRPNAIPDAPAYRRRLGEFLTRADVVKVSTDDLRFLDPGAPFADAARALLAHGPRAVLVTDGAAPVTAYTGASHLTVPVPSVPVVDTVGAGDAFSAAFLAWWTEQSCTRGGVEEPAILRGATVAAVGVASATCMGRGAHPPGSPGSLLASAAPRAS
jgi:fructokinase